ncbi:MAG: DUF58 domain-containing protein [Acidimicrobiaceae bacterium]|nr:DUF58 domain-containing protein [Acidimicrobiia bacterium]MCY4493847.1 DUF58 domain-containing protein [Acidimicrobiaceae bacterium]
MPTPTGWWVLGVGLAAGVFGRLIGSIELIVPAAAAVAAVGLGLLRLLLPTRLSVKKQLSAVRVPAGGSVRVDIELRNGGARRTPVLRLHDTVGGTRGFSVEIAPVAAGDTASISYRLNTADRGLQQIGPLTVSDSDAFGLVRRRRQFRGVLRLIVHPRLEAVAAPRAAASEDSLLGREHHRALGLSDEDFDGLRPYIPGDDLRRVHWASSARHDELLVRRHRPPRLGLLSVVIDTRPPGDSESVLDISTSIAGSIAASVLGAGDAALVETTDGRSTRRVVGTSQLDLLLEFLALLADGSPEVHAAVPSSGGPVVAVSADPLLVADPAARRNFAQRLRARLVITADAENWGGDHRPHRSAGWIHLTAPDQLGGLLLPDRLRPQESA